MKRATKRISSTVGVNNNSKIVIKNKIKKKKSKSSRIKILSENSKYTDDFKGETQQENQSEIYVSSTQTNILPPISAKNGRISMQFVNLDEFEKQLDELDLQLIPKLQQRISVLQCKKQQSENVEILPRNKIEENGLFTF